MTNSMARALALALMGLPTSFHSSAVHAETVTVDYGGASHPSRFVASGYLHGIDESSPASYLIDDVRVTAIRGADEHPFLPSLFDPETYRRVAQTGAALMVGTYYYTGRSGHPYGDYRPGDNGDDDTYRQIVRSVLDDARRKQVKVFSWITWNEPDLQFNTPARPFAHYLAGHKAAYDTIKAYDPAYRVQAPEMSGYYPDRIRQFLLYCRDNHCLPDILSWHELTNNPADVEGHVRDARAFMERNGIAPMPVAITEYQGQGFGNPEAYNAGKNVSWLARFERSSQDGLLYALYSDWEHGADPKFRATLGNAVDGDGLLPHGVWWNYNAYKDMTGAMRPVTTGSNALDAMAGADPRLHRSVVLVGNQLAASTPVTLALDRISPDLVANGKAHIRARIIPNDKVVTALKTAYEADIAVPTGRASVTLPPLPAYAAYRIDVTPPTAGKAVVSYEAETLRQTHSASASYDLFDEAAASGGKAAVLRATSAGQWVRYTISLKEPGIYDLAAVMKTEFNRGMAQLYIDGEAISCPQDQYGPPSYDRRDLGNVALSAGDHSVQFVAAAKSPSSSGYDLVFDRLDLTKLD